MSEHASPRAGRSSFVRKRAASTPQGGDSLDHVLKYTGLFGGVQGLTMLASLIRNKIVSEMLGPSGLALINLFYNAVRLVSQSTDFGLPFSAVRHMARDNGGRMAPLVVRFWCLLAGVLGVLVCLVLSRQLSWWTFGTYDYARHFAVLSPAVGMLTVQGGELAILKGRRQLGKVALVSVWSAVLTLLICTVVYSIWGADGIVCSLLLCGAASLACHLYFSMRLIPWESPCGNSPDGNNGGRVGLWRAGFPMLALGVGYILAGVCGQGAEYLIRTQILGYGSLDDVGYYNSGYTLAVSYANLVFVAFEADYFPRLSACPREASATNLVVNRQIVAGLLLMTPFLSLFALAAPIAVPLLFSSRFVPAVPMAVCASFYMFFKALTLPVAYLALARGDSRMYMLTEIVYDVFVVLAVPQAFRLWGLEGAGWALSAAGLFNLALIYITYGIRYRFRYDGRNLTVSLAQFACLCVAVVSALQESQWMRWVTVAAIVASAAVSLMVLRRETQILDTLKRRLWRK